MFLIFTSMIVLLYYVVFEENIHVKRCFEAIEFFM